MITVSETVETRLDPARAFAYLSEFEHTADWDPGTVSSTKATDGLAAVGSRYQLVAEFRGRKSDIEYVVTELQGGRITLRGENDRVISIDTIEVSPTPSGGSSVRYLAEFSIKGLFKIAEPLLGPAFKKLGPPAALGMKRKLDDLAAGVPA